MNTDKEWNSENITRPNIKDLFILNIALEWQNKRHELCNYLKYE